MGLLLFASICQAASYRATVTEVVDGDTVKVKISGKEETFELAHIDCPELSQPYGAEAAKYVRKRISSKEIYLTTKYKELGTTYAEVIIPGGRNLNFELVGKGLAWASKDNPSDIANKLQKRATKSKTGLWAQENPAPPWEKRPGKADKIIKYAGAIAAGRQQAADPLVAAKNELIGGNPERITASDYTIRANASQSENIVTISGRISDGPECQNITVSAYAVSDTGRRAHVTTTTSMGKGVKSTLFSGTDKISYSENVDREEWNVTDLYIRCR